MPHDKIVKFVNYDNPLIFDNVGKRFSKWPESFAIHATYFAPETGILEGGSEEETL